MYLSKREYFLKHHGVQGQKWGVRNGPPYPLDSSKSTGKKLKKNAKLARKLYKKSEKGGENLTKASQKISEIAERVITIEEKLYIKDCFDKMSNAMKKMAELEKIYINEAYGYEDMREYLDSKRFKKIETQLIKASEEYDSNWVKTQEIGKEITDRLLGEYGNIPIDKKYKYYTTKDFVSGNINFRKMKFIKSQT